MISILPLSVYLNQDSPDLELPVEMWSAILRKLDSKSLLVAVKTYPHWLHIARGDPILRRTIRKQIKGEEKARKQEIANPSLLVSITRTNDLVSDLSVNTKLVRRRAPTVLTAPELKDAFKLRRKGSKTNESGCGPMRREREVRRKPYMRC